MSKIDYIRTPDGSQRIVDGNLKVQNYLSIPVFSAEETLNDNPDEAGPIAINQDGRFAYYDGEAWQTADGLPAGGSSADYLRGDGTWQTLDTDAVAEGSNLYYTSARFNSAFAAKSTSDLAEGSNLYYTSTRFNTDFASKTTTDLTEGTNLYYTSARFNTSFGSKNTDDLTEGSTNLYYTSSRFVTDFEALSTSYLPEGSNLYFTNARVQTYGDANYVLLSSANSANGYAKLDTSGLIPLSLIPDTLLGNVKYKGTYDGSTVTSPDSALNGNPLPTAASGNQGYYFIITAATTISGVDYSVGDWVISDGSAGYTRVENSDAVTTVFGRNGNVVAVNTDYAAYYPQFTGSYADPSWITSIAQSKIVYSGTTAQYVRGDGSFATFPTNVSSFTNDSSYTTLSAVSAIYAPIASPTFTGTATAPTYSASTYTGSGTNLNITTNGGNSNSTISLDFPGISTTTGQIRIGRLTTTTAAFGLGVYKGDGTGTINAYISGNSNSYFNASTGNVSIGSASVSGSKLGINGGVSIGSGQFTNASPTNGLLVQGQVSLLGGISMSGNISASSGANNTFGNVIGTNIHQASATYTDTSTASSTTLTYNSANVFNAPVFASTNTSVTYTFPSTIQINGAPTAGTNVALTSPVSLLVLAGSSVFNGGISTSTGGFFSNANLVGNQVAISTNISQYQFGGSSNVALRSGFYGSTSTTITSGYSYGSVILASAPFTTASGSTTAWAANMVINPLGTITLGGGGASLTNSTTLFVGAASSTGTNKYTAYFDTGNVQIANGNITLATAGNGILIKEGTNATMGTGTLSGGTLTVSTTKVTANSRIFIQNEGGGVSGNYGILAVTSKSAGTSFTVTSSNVLDTATFTWLIIEPA